MKNKRQVTPVLIRGGRPKNIHDLLELWHEGIRAIICLQEGITWFFGGYRTDKDWQGFGGHQWKTPLSNFRAPTKKQCDDICKIIHQFRIRKQTVFLHCRAGVDRTGFVSAYYVWKYCEISPEAAWNYAGETGMHFWYRIFWKKAFFKAVIGERYERQSDAGNRTGANNDQRVESIERREP